MIPKLVDVDAVLNPVTELRVPPEAEVSNTFFVPSVGQATGPGGSETVTVIVDDTACEGIAVSATWYPTGVAFPEKVESGSKVTVPFELTVYVPSFGIDNVVRVQLGADCAGVVVGSQSFTELESIGKPGAASFANTLIV